MGYGIKKIFVTRLTDTKTNAEGDAEGVGTIRWEGSKAYKWVQYNQGAGSVAAVAGNAAYYYAAGGTSTNQDTVVTSDLSDSAEVGAGILQAVISNLGYGWIQIKGKATMASAFTAGADGDPLTPTGSSDGKLDVTALVTDPVCAVADDASVFSIFCDFPF